MGLNCLVKSADPLIKPSLAGFILDTHGNNNFSWSIIWAVSGLVLMFGGIFFAVFVDGEVQPWAKSNQTDSNENYNKLLLSEKKLRNKN